MARPRIGVHVIGPKWGECIVLELPDETVGVIDCFSSRKLRPVLLDFLAARFPALDRLRFLGLTHPHADHCLGLSCLADEFAINEFWVFQPFPAGHLHQYYDALCRARTREALEELLDLPAGTISLELGRFNHAIARQHRETGARVRQLRMSTDLHVCDGQVLVHRLTPSDDICHTYQQQLVRATESIFADGPTLKTGWQPPDIDHNLASGGLLLEFGKTRLLFMADAEKPLWRDWLSANPSVFLSPVHFLKAAHHGSANGYLGDLYNCLSSAEFTFAVVTPFNQGRKQLPSGEGIRAIAPHVEKLYCANRTVAHHSTGLDWAEVEPFSPLPPVPGHWAAQCAKEPALIALLHPRAGGTGTAPDPAVVVPLRWSQDCQRDHRLLALLRPEIRDRDVVPGSFRAVDDFRVSVYYDDHGNVLELEVGRGAGLLRK